MQYIYLRIEDIKLFYFFHFISLFTLRAVRRFCIFNFWQKNQYAAHLIYDHFFYCRSYIQLTLNQFGNLYFTGILILNQSQPRMLQVAANLHINAVQRNDSGRYTCAKITSDKQTQRVQILRNLKLEIICK